MKGNFYFFRIYSCHWFYWFIPKSLTETAGGIIMRLEISNFAKIGKAELDLNGITVIVGENNTGKTTVGKILFCIFNSMYELEKQIDQKINNEIRRICVIFLRDVLVDARLAHAENYWSNISFRKNEDIGFLIADEICNTNSDCFSIQEFKKIILKYCKTNGFKIRDDSQDILEEMYSRIESILQSDRQSVANELVYRYFDSNFASQMCSLASLDNEATIKLTIKNSAICVNFARDSVSFNKNINIMNEAYFIDDPFILDDIQLWNSGSFHSYVRPKDFLTHKLRSNEGKSESIFDAVNAKEKIAVLMEIISGIVPGKINQKGGKWSLSSQFFDTPVDFYNLSAGLKSFVLLKMLLEEGIIKEKDLIILDEPEIHQHPEWQLKYAEIIVLFQKMFDLTIVVTTHSRDFFEAIDLYSKKYGIKDRCNYYLSKQSYGISTFEDMTNDTASIYRQLVNPSRLLDKLRFELEDKEND